MRDNNRANKKEWYKHGWGLIVAVLFFPYFIVWYAWAKSKWGKGTKIAVTALTAIIMLPVTLGVLMTDTTRQNMDTKNVQPPAAQPQPEESSSSELASNTAPTQPVEAPKPIETVSQKNAVGKAKSYLSYTAFSYEGLIDQLVFEQFSKEDARYGADNSGGDWMEQAAKKAKSYMDYSSFSRGSLISQLEYDKFTPQQAAHGADSVGL